MRAYSAFILEAVEFDEVGFGLFSGRRTHEDDDFVAGLAVSLVAHEVFDVLEHCVGIIGHFEHVRFYAPVHGELMVDALVWGAGDNYLARAISGQEACCGAGVGENDDT